MLRGFRTTQPGKCHVVGRSEVAFREFASDCEWLVASGWLLLKVAQAGVITVHLHSDSKRIEARRESSRAPRLVHEQQK